MMNAMLFRMSSAKCITARKVRVILGSHFTPRATCAETYFSMCSQTLIRRHQQHVSQSTHGMPHLAEKGAWKVPLMSYEVAIRVLECRAATSEKEDLGSDSETKTQCPSTEELPDISSMGTTPYTSVGESYGSEGIGLTRCQSEENVAEICDREEAA
mmetsp:Transcript_37716/g.69787  ORF Transcript_37716/g.69787 Transcript_37716/m.69787 type:complete len:157 (+) Transcript_37716:162-632(+)